YSRSSTTRSVPDDPASIPRATRSTSLEVLLHRPVGDAEAYRSTVTAPTRPTCAADSRRSSRPSDLLRPNDPARDSWAALATRIWLDQAHARTVGVALDPAVIHIDDGQVLSVNRYEPRQLLVTQRLGLAQRLLASTDNP